MILRWLVAFFLIFDEFQRHEPTEMDPSIQLQLCRQILQRSLGGSGVESNTLELQKLSLEYWTQRAGTSDGVLSTTVAGLEDKAGSSANTSGDSIIDRALGGGFRRGMVTEVYGEAGCGKTQLLLQACTRASAAGQVSVYIVSEDIPHIRLQQIAEASAAVYGTSSRAVLQQLMIARAHHSEYLLSILQPGGLLDLHVSQLSATSVGGLVAIDSIAGCVGNAQEAEQVAFALKSFANRNPHIAFLVANQVRSNIGSSNHTSSVLPALGLNWTLGIHMRIGLFRKPGGDQREFASVFSSFLPPFRGFFTIDNSGVHGVSF